MDCLVQSHLFKKGKQKQISQACIQLLVSLGMDAHNLFVQPIPVFDHPHSKNSVFLCSDEIACPFIRASHPVTEHY